MKCLGCGHETETPWQCICGWRRMPTQEDVDTLARSLLQRREEWRKERAAFLERERMRQRAERRRRLAELLREEHRHRREEAERRTKAPPRKPKHQGPVIPFWLRDLFAHPPVVWAPPPPPPEPESEPEPEPVADPPEVRRQYKRYRRARAKIRGMAAERRFFEQRNEAAHQHFLRLADQVAESLPDRGPGEIWWD